MLVSGVAIWRCWQTQQGPDPDVMAGHSLGEYTALVAAGSIRLEDAVTLVTDRGRFMQEAVPAGTGAMAAILGLEDDKIIEVCTEAAQGEVVSAVNFNSPGQVVVAGNAGAVERAIALATEAGAKRAVKLPVSVPSHCSLMKSAAERLAQRLAGIDIKTPAIPVINNVDVKIEQDPDAIRDALQRQLFMPVRWVETVQAIAKQGVPHIVECGPGKVLAGLNKRISREIENHATLDSASLQQTLAKLKQEG